MEIMRQITSMTQSTSKHLMKTYLVISTYGKMITFNSYEMTHFLMNFEHHFLNEF